MQGGHIGNGHVMDCFINLGGDMHNKIDNVDGASAQNTTVGGGPG